MATLKNLKPNQILYKVRREKAGHSTMSRQVVDTIRIVTINLESGIAIDSRNRKYRDWQLKTWRVNKPQEKGRDILGNPKY